MQHLFVYGTLRPGGGNDWLLADPTITHRAATADGLGLYDGPGFPYAAALADHTIAGTIYAVPDDLWLGRLRSLDLLEGYDADHERTSHYLRRRWTVTPSAPAGPPLRAWLYLAGHRVRGLTPDRLIASGDWMRRREQTPE